MQNSEKNKSKFTASPTQNTITVNLTIYKETCKKQKHDTTNLW